MNKLSLHCLIIDNNADDIELVRSKMATASCFAMTVIPCRSLEAIPTIPANTAIDIILLDYQLAAVTGLETLTLLREKGYYQPVIILTSQENEQIAIEVMNSGVCDSLSKEELTTRSLERAIANALKKVVSEAKVEGQQQQILKQATTDSLTGLNNRGYCMQRFDKAWQQAVRYNQPLSLLLLDLDHFKHINDTFGHPTGDEVLTRIGQLIRSLLRDTAIAGRYGGGEFIIVLDDTTLEEATTLAERLRQAIAHESFPVESTRTLPLTCSIGVSCLDRDRDIKNIDTLLKAADEALFLAKSRGRNQVTVNPRHEHLRSKAQVQCQCPECVVKKGRILIVDDDQISLSLLRRMLAPSVETIHEASSAPEALAFLDHEQVDILITDLIMPGMDGLELMRRARSLLPDLQVIIVTANESRATVLTAMRLGAINYLTKPIHVEELSISVHQGMERLNLLREVKRRESLCENGKKTLLWLIEAHPSPLLVIDDHGSCRFTNQAAARLFGIPAGLSPNWRFGLVSQRQETEEICLLPPGKPPCLATMRISSATWDDAEVLFVIFDELREVAKGKRQPVSLIFQLHQPSACSNDY